MKKNKANGSLFYRAACLAAILLAVFLSVQSINVYAGTPDASYASAAGTFTQKTSVKYAFSPSTETGTDASAESSALTKETAKAQIADYYNMYASKIKSAGNESKALSYVTGMVGDLSSTAAGGALSNISEASSLEDFVTMVKADIANYAVAETESQSETAQAETSDALTQAEAKTLIINCYKMYLDKIAEAGKQTEARNYVTSMVGDPGNITIGGTLSGIVESSSLEEFVSMVKEDIKAYAGEEAESDETVTSTPRVIVTGFTTNPEEVKAGDTFTLTLSIKNTSKSTAVSNMLFDIQAESESTDSTYVAAAFLPTAGSSIIYLDKIEADSSKDISIEMEARSDLSQKPYVMNVNMKYEDSKANAYENTSSVSIPVKQEAKVELSSIDLSPDSIEVGDEANVMFSLYNTGKTTLYNTKISFEADSVSGGDTYLGNISPGATSSVDTYITGAAATTDDGNVKIIIYFEDESGEATTIESEMELYVTEAYVDDEIIDGTDDGYIDDMNTSGGFKLWYVIVPAAVLIIAAIIVIIVVSKKKKAKKKAADDDFSDDDGDIEIDSIDIDGSGSDKDGED